MTSDVLRRRLEALRVQRARIDLAIEQLVAQIEAQELAEKKGAEVWRSNLPEAEGPACCEGGKEQG